MRRGPIGPAGAGGPAGPSNMQAAYNGGPNITVAAATPMVDTGASAGVGTWRRFVNSAAAVLFDISDNASQIIRSGIADGASAVGLIIDVIASLANASAKLVSIRNAGAEKVAVMSDGSIWPGANNASDLGDPLGNAWRTLEAYTFRVVALLRPDSDLASAIGTSALRFTNAFLQRYFMKGTALVAGDFVLSAGWGTTASLTVTRGSDGAWEIQVTSTGTGQGANPTITHTYKDGSYTTVPIFIAIPNGATGATLPTVTNCRCAETATQNVITVVGTPTANDTIKIRVIGMGT